MIETNDCLEFIVEEKADGAYTAHSIGACIMTEAVDMAGLTRAIKEAICCHFDGDCRPVKVRLRLIEVVEERTITI